MLSFVVFSCMIASVMTSFDFVLAASIPALIVAFSFELIHSNAASAFFLAISFSRCGCFLSAEMSGV